MINFNNLNESPPYKIFLSYYEKALQKNNPDIEAILIASLNQGTQEVDARFVNLKYIQNNDWIFFTNYGSPKATQFESHNQITAVFFWHTINVQIRIKAKIKKLNNKICDEHFQNRSFKKNALAISSSQSKKIASYEQIEKKYQLIVESNSVLVERPSHWGGYSFTPYYFEFWEGHKSRINKREVFELKNGDWQNFFLEP